MLKKVNHIGIAVKDLDKTVKFFREAYGAILHWRKKFEDQKIESAFISIGEAQFELSARLEPGRLSSPSLLRIKVREFTIYPWRRISLTW